MYSCMSILPNILTYCSLPDFPGSPRYFPVSASLDGSGYVACGISPDGIRHSDIWKYDPLLDSWTKKKDFPGAGREGANIFIVDAKIYIGSGSTASVKLNDYWEYNPITNDWIEIAGIPVGRTGAFSFVIANKVYIGSGLEADNYINSFWRLSL